MKRTRNRSTRSVARPRPLAVLERIDAFLAHTNEHPNAEKIRLMRLALFADVDALQASGTVKLPQ